jgi:hypothetical protein
MAVALLASALAVAITVALHYRGEVAALRGHPPPPPVSVPRSGARLTLTSSTVALPRHGTLVGVVTVISARSSGDLAQVALSAHITGGRPHTGYTVVGFDCAGSSGYESWAAGVTNADGSGNLTGHAWLVSLRDSYWLYLSPSSGSTGRGLHGSFTAAGRFSAVPAGDPACP